MRRMLAITLLLFLSLVDLSALEMKAGVSKIVISPPDMERKPVSVMGAPLEGIAHDLYARILVLNDGERRMVFVANDLNCLDVATSLLRVRLRDELGIPPAYFIPLATHNHSAPIQIVPDNFPYGRWLSERIFQGIEQAIASETGPVQVQFGSGAAYFLKSVGNAPVDYEVQLLKVTQGEQPVALFFNHPTHPMQIDIEKAQTPYRIETGHPGLAVEEVERRIPGALALYADAAGGNQFTKELMEGAPERVEAVAKELADAVCAIGPAALRDVSGPLSSELKVIPLSLAPPISREDAQRLAEDAHKRFPDVEGFVPYPNPARDTNWIRSLIKHYDEGIPFPKRTTDLVCSDDGFLMTKPADAREFPCTYEETIVSKIGPFIFVAMQGEVCSPIAMRIKDAFRYEHPIMVNAYMGEHNLYIPTRELVRLNLYQARVIQTQYASPVGWAASVEDEMVGGVCQMIRDALREN